MRWLVLAVVVACSSPHDERHDPPVHGSNTTPTLAIAIVLFGQEIWVGNSDYERDENARYDGWLHTIESGIDELPLAKVGPPGSQAVVVSYAANAEIKLPMGPLERLTGATLGTQADYRGKIGDDVVAGMSLGLAELARVSADRKLLFTITGNLYPSDEEARAKLATLATQAKQAGIERFAILLTERVSNDGPADTPLGHTEITTTGAGIAAIFRVDIDRR